MRGWPRALAAVALGSIQGQSLAGWVNFTDATVVRYYDLEGEYLVRFGDDSTERMSREFVVPTELDVLNYVWQRKEKLPAWYKMVKVMVHMQPSSAAAERIFSLLAAFFKSNGRTRAAKKDERLATPQLRSHDRPV